MLECLKAYGFFSMYRRLALACAPRLACYSRRDRSREQASIGHDLICIPTKLLYLTMRIRFRLALSTLVLALVMTSHSAQAQEGFVVPTFLGEVTFTLQERATYRVSFGGHPIQFGLHVRSDEYNESGNEQFFGAGTYTVTLADGIQFTYEAEDDGYGDYELETSVLGADNFAALMADQRFNDEALMGLFGSEGERSGYMSCWAEDIRIGIATDLISLLLPRQMIQPIGETAFGATTLHAEVYRFNVSSASKLCHRDPFNFITHLTVGGVRDSFRVSYRLRDAATNDQAITLELPTVSTISTSLEFETKQDSLRLLRVGDQLPAVDPAKVEEHQFKMRSFQVPHGELRGILDLAYDLLDDAFVALLEEHATVEKGLDFGEATVTLYESGGEERRLTLEGVEGRKKSDAELMSSGGSFGFPSGVQDEPKTSGGGIFSGTAEAFAGLVSDLASDSPATGVDDMGLVYVIKDGQPHVVGIAENGPAQVAGIAVGDVLVAADDALFANQSNSDIRDRLAGAKGTVVTLKVLRDGETLALSVTR